MTRNDWIVLCLAYIVGLLSTNLIALPALGFTQVQLWQLSAGFIALAGTIAIAARAIKLQPSIKIRTWVGAAIVAILAVGYLQLRIPQPQENDLSYQITASTSEVVTVAGKVLSEPRLNDSQRLKFLLQTTAINRQKDDREQVSGKLYVTLPLLSGTGIYPGQRLQITGLLYLPQAAKNGGFDFKQYLARQGVFAGMQGQEAIFGQQTEPTWGWWKLRRRIVRSQLQGLGSPLGQLVSSMILGRKAVDLPSDIRDRFVEAGLAHVLAASGFHVSILLGIILKLTERIKAKPRLVIGIGTLMIYLGLTGIQPSVLRACLMGSAVLLSLTMELKVKPLGSLLLVATIILLFNPLAIADLGFQLSFLATFGLIVTLPGLQAKLDWLPPTVSTIVAVPLAATIWVLPLLAYKFNTLATYSIAVNILCTPLITLISLGGMTSAIAAVIVPEFGSAISSILFYPTRLLMAIVNFFTSLPGSTWAIGQISLGILVGIYGLLLLIWLNSWWRKRWWMGLSLIAAMAAIQLLGNSSQLQVTLLAARQSQIIVIQDRKVTILINSGINNQAKYLVIPFLAQQGINQIDHGLALDNNSNSAAEWSEIYARARVLSFVSAVDSIPILSTQRTQTGSLDNQITESISLDIDKELAIINLKIVDRTWVILGKTTATEGKIKQYIKQHNLLDRHPIIVWSGGNLASTWLELLQPEIAIATDLPQATTQRDFDDVQFYSLKQDGAINWTPNNGVKPLKDSWDS